jgi:hypothetical protein
MKHFTTLVIVDGQALDYPKDIPIPSLGHFVIIGLVKAEVIEVVHNIDFLETRIICKQC